MKVQGIVEIMKEALVQVAEEDLLRRSETPTINRISVMTGLHRQDISRIKSGEAGKKGADSLTRIIGQWRGNKRFLTESNRPRVLNLNAKSGSFVNLVESVSKDLNPYTVAFELERLKLVKRDGEKISLLSREYVPRRNLLEAATLVGLDIQDILNAGEANALQSSVVPNLHLTTRYDNISAEALPKIQKWLMQEGSNLHERARNFISKFDQDLNPDEIKEQSAGCYASIGTFSFVSDPRSSGQN